MFFLTDSNLLYIIVIRNKIFIFGTFNLGWKYQGHTVSRHSVSRGQCYITKFDFSNVYDFRYSIEHMSMNGGRQLCKSFSSLLSAILMNETTSCWIKKTYQNLKWDFSSDRDDITIFHLLSRSTIKVQRIILYLVP